MVDRICVEGLAVVADIGVHAYERDRPQRLSIDVRVETDFREASRRDALEATLDYDRIAAACREVATERHHSLLETVAERIAERLLAEHAGRISTVYVRIEKPGAVPDARTVAVEISRTHKL